jgi:hypothetical protein
MSDVQVHDLSALRMATAEFKFSLNATSAANAIVRGYRDIGNLVLCGFQPEKQEVSHKGSYRGVRRKDKTFIIDAGLKYRLQADELGPKNLMLALFGEATTGFTQTAKSAVSGDALAFSGTAAVLGFWYPLTISGARVREITTVTIATLTEGTDFEVDKKLGLIRFLTAQSTDRTPVITAAAVTASDTAALSGIVPLAETVQRGFGELALFDDNHPNDLVYHHVDFGCDVYFDSMDEFTGEDVAKETLIVEVTTPVGVAYAK